MDRSLDGYIDFFGPYTFGATGASLFFAQASINEAYLTLGWMNVVGMGAISFVGQQVGTFFYPSNIPYGGLISSANAFYPTLPTHFGYIAWSPEFPNSQFLDPGLSFVGFRFDVGQGTQYGFAEIVIDGFPLNTGTLVGYGWGDPGEFIFGGSARSRRQIVWESWRLEH